MSIVTGRRPRQYAVFIRKGRQWIQFSSTVDKKQAEKDLFDNVETFKRMSVRAEVRPLDNPPLPPQPKLIVVKDPSRPVGANCMVVPLEARLALLSREWTTEEAAVRLVELLYHPQ